MNLEIDCFQDAPAHRDDSSLQVSCRSSFLGAVSPISCSDKKADFGEFLGSNISDPEPEQKKEVP